MKLRTFQVGVYYVQLLTTDNLFYIEYFRRMQMLERLEHNDRDVARDQFDLICKVLSKISNSEIEEQNKKFIH